MQCYAATISGTSWTCDKCPGREVCEILAFVDLFRLKRAYDGHNGRVWSAIKHYDAEMAINKILEGAEWED